MKPPVFPTRTLLDGLRSLRDVLMPRSCPICGARMHTGEDFCCTACLAALPYTHFRGERANPVERLFWGQFPVGRASAWFYYERGNRTTALIRALKYHRRRSLGLPLGKAAANELAGTSFFTDIDAIVPIPLSRKRYRQRGYNVCDDIARGVSLVTHLPVCRHAVKRTVDNPTQTRQLPFERKQNVQGIFSVEQPSLVRGRHLLLVEDVVTTGATVASCAAALAAAGARCVSVLALAVSGNITRTPPADNDLY